MFRLVKAETMLPEKLLQKKKTKQRQSFTQKEDDPREEHEIEGSNRKQQKE